VLSDARDRTRPPLRQLLDPRFVLARLLSHRRLLRLLVRREIETRYRGSAFGVGWLVAQPALLLAVYTFVFGIVLEVRWPQLEREGLGDFAAVLFCGLIVMNLFNECVGRAPGLILGAVGYVKKVVFPLELLPLVVLGSAAFHAAISLAVLLVARYWLGSPPPATVLLVPVVLLPLAMLALGLSWFLASLGVFVRDVGQVVQLALQALIFLTPVFYPMEALPLRFQGLIRLNPLTVVVEALRDVALWGRFPDWGPFTLVLAGSGLILLSGYAWFSATRRAFADVV
jgi:lipopolysaccharide transport system permease protein